MEFGELVVWKRVGVAPSNGADERGQRGGSWVLWVGRCRTGRAPRRPAPPGTAAISSFARKWPQEAYAAFWATDLWALMGPRSRLVGLEWRPVSPFGVAERLQSPVYF